MSNWFENFSRSSSHSNMSRMENDLKIIYKKNTWNFDNQLNVSIDTLEQYIKNWNMPRQKIKEIYKIGTFEFMSNYLIKISKNTHSIGWETKTNELLNSKDLKPLRKKFKALHIGAVQVEVEPLTRLRSPFVSVSEMIGTTILMTPFVSVSEMVGTTILMTHFWESWNQTWLIAQFISIVFQT